MPASFRCGPFTVVPDAGRVVGPAGPVHLRPRAMDVLVALAGRGGEVVGKAELLDEVWGGAAVSEAVLTNAVAELRRAFGGRPGPRGLIETIPRRGYRLTAPVVSDDAAVDPSRSLAALPFEDLTPEAPNEPLLTAVVDALLGELARASRWRVVARQSTARFRGASRPLARIGRELRVGKLITGQAMRNGARLRLNVQLLDLPRERVLWSTSLVAMSGDPVELPVALARAVACEIARVLDLPIAPLRPDSSRLDARTSELFLRGQSRLRGPTVRDLERGLADLAEVVQRAPRLAAAHAGLARGCFYDASWRCDVGGELLARAEAAAARALDLDPDLVEAQVWWAMVRGPGRWQANDGLWELARIVRAHPHNGEARDALAHCLAMLGRSSEAVAEERRALADDPGSPVLRTALGFFLRVAGELEAARTELAGTLELHPDWTIARLELGRVELARGDVARASREIGRVEPEWGRFLSALAHDRAEEVERDLARWHRRPARSPFWLAERCLWAGRTALALDALERAYRERQLRVLYCGVDPTFAPLRGSARFEALLVRAGLRERRAASPGGITSRSR
jgi:serine/threonine-protein kinase